MVHTGKIDFRWHWGLGLALLLVCATSFSREIAVSDIDVELTTPRLLHVTIRSRAETQFSFFKWRLPWGNRNSMILVAVRTDGSQIPRNIPIDDPTPERISVAPNESLSGDVSLDKAFTDLDTALKRSAIHLFWAYKAPKELNIAEWSGGWILIPQQK